MISLCILYNRERNCEEEQAIKMNLLTMEHITKSYTDRVLLDDVGFSINENEKIGVIGINGMGKSCLLYTSLSSCETWRAWEMAWL